MQVSSKEKKQMETKEEIEKALLTYCSQLGDLEVWKGGGGGTVQLNCPSHEMVM